MKVLPEKTSDEIFLTMDYAICRFMKNKRAYKTCQNQAGIYLTMKKVQEKNLHPQYHIHLRFAGRDHWYGDDDTIDVDCYIHESEMSKIVSLGMKRKIVRQEVIDDGKEKEKHPGDNNAVDTGDERIEGGL